MHAQRTGTIVYVYMSTHYACTEDWHYRHAALMAISAIGEGCEKQMQPILGEVINAVLPYCQDSVSEGGREGVSELVTNS